MNINMKYYIVTICAIFIALGVGILVGFNLNYDQALSKQQSEVLESFNTEFEDLKDKNKILKTEFDDLNKDLQETKSYINRNVKVLTQDVLTDVNTGIIITNENHDYSEDVETVISNANGNVVFNIVVKDNISDEAKLAEISKSLEKTFKSSKDVIDYIGNSLSNPNGYEGLNVLQDLGVIKINNMDEKTYQDFDSVVLLGDIDKEEGKDKFELKDKLLINNLKDQNKYLVAAAQSDSDITYLELCSKNDISTIDNINEGIGKVSLTTLLKNKNIVGSYGGSEISKEFMAYKNN
ncbi:MAG: copper transporter [Terrisporobacter sp.]|uniref:copper transporter n=1 Tax=Terrisporobacter sp. TaxID=1965305 RepID=UPI002FC5B77D